MESASTPAASNLRPVVTAVDSYQDVELNEIRDPSIIKVHSPGGNSTPGFRYAGEARVLPPAGKTTGETGTCLCLHLVVYSCSVERGSQSDAAHAAPLV